jgi:iron complex outermembrane receptor protein
MRIPFAILALCSPFWLSLPALAQPREEPIAAADAPDADTITVRGQREPRFFAPLSAVTLSSNQSQSLRTLDDVAVAVPGLTMINDQDPGTNIVALRGVTTDRLQQAAIVYVVDSVPLADTELFTGPLFDVRTIQVLRGPQGALFGKGAAGGVVAVETGGEGGYVSLGLGNGGSRIGQAAASFDVSPTWTLRAAGQWRAADGWITNRTLNRVVDAEESRAVRLTAQGPLGWINLASFGLLLMQDSGGAAWASSGDITGDFGGKLDGAALTDPIGDFEGRSAREWIQARARFQVDTQDSELSLLLAQDAYQKRWVEELDYRPGALTFFGAPLFPNGLQPIAQPTDIDASTAELRYTWAPTPTTNLVAGLFAQAVDRQRTDDFGPLLFGGPALRYNTQSVQTAAFAGVFHTAGRFRLEAQLRYDIDDRTQDISAPTGRLERRQASFERLQPRVGASFELTPNAVAYASLGEGFRSGGFNPRPAPASVWRAQFEAEITRSAELGLRLRARPALPHQWHLELTGFGAEISNYQNYTFLDGQSVTLNVDQVSVSGGEISAGLQAPLAGAWSYDVQASAALSRTEIDRYLAPDPLIAGATRNYAGKRVPNAPEWTGVATARLVWQQTDQTADLSLTLNAAGETFYEIDNALRSPPRTWADARASYQNGDWTIALWGRNITNERWAISAFGQGMLPLLAGLGPGGPFDTFTINRGRQTGVELRREF